MFSVILTTILGALCLVFIVSVLCRIGSLLPYGVDEVIEFILDIIIFFAFCISAYIFGSLVVAFVYLLF